MKPGIFAPMFRFAAALVCLALAGCAPPTEEAAKNAKRLISAAWADDRPRFEAKIDRDAVREDLRRQLLEAGRASGIEVDGGPSDLALDRMIGPEAVRASVPEAVAQGPTENIQKGLKSVDDGKACLPDEASGACLLTFGRQKGAWRLVGLHVGGPSSYE